jgi:hypothetical protein
MHIPVWVGQGWYAKYRGNEEWRNTWQNNELNTEILSLEEIYSRCGDKYRAYSPTDLQDL